MQPSTFTLNLREETAPHFARLVLSRKMPEARTAMDVVISHRAPAERASAEAFIRAVYVRAYDASLDVRYPTLMSIGGEQGISAAMGLRNAGHERLFLEHYLDKPIEEALFDATGETVKRSEIIEVGNLASSGLGAAKYLYLAFHAYAYERGYRYVAVTATSALARSFEHMGLKAQWLAKADPARLPGKGEGWGSYYDAQPQVIAGDIAQSLSVLMRRYGGEYQPLEVALHTLAGGGHA